MNRESLHPKPTSWGRSTVVACVLAFMSAPLIHCVDGESGLPGPGSGLLSPSGAGGGTSGDDGDGVLEGPCDEEGEARACTAHHEAGCASGVQTCTAGMWSPCQPDPTPSIQDRDLADDPAARCGEDGTTANVCDADCRGVTPHNPDLGAGGIDADWQSGSLGELPAAALSAGIPADCANDAVCQMDHYCDEAADGGRGECEAWSPGGFNEGTGTKYDVTVGVACDDKVPVCNRGNVPVPRADLDAMRIQWKTAPPYSMGGCTMASPAGSCAVAATEDLDVGRCLEVACDVPANRVVHLDAGAGNAREFECGNNWSFNSDGACSEPACGADVSSVTEVKLALFLSLDISGSMLWDRNCPYDKACTGNCSASNCSGSCTSSTQCSTFKSNTGKCCWNAETPTTSRWGAVHTALDEFVGDAESDGLGVVMKFWGTGTCQASACNAVDDFPEAGSCSHNLCDTGTRLTNGCAPYVADVCSTAAREYCCGEQPRGTCTFSPCSTNAGTLVSGCGGTSTPIKTSTTATCAVKGFEGCCNGTPGTGGAWGMNKAPCTATTSMTCRNAAGTSIACNSAAAAGAPTTSFTYAAYQTAIVTPSCITTWSAACVSTFRTKFAANNEGRDPCNKAWDGGCVAKYIELAGSTPGSSCIYAQWDAACATTAASKGAVCSSTACNRPSIPATCTSAGTCPLVLSSASPDPAEVAIKDKLNTIVPSGGTPSAIAIEGAGDFCIDYQAAHPDERCVVVFVSDGQPNGCGDANAVYAAATNASDNDVNVFAIGISGAGTDFMNTVARDGNTDSAFFISPDRTASSDFLKALETIRNQFSCRERLPAGATLESVDVRFHDGATRRDMVAVNNLAACATLAAGALGYYSVSSDEIALCPESCRTATSRPTGVIEIVNECGPPATPVTISDAFTAGTACDDVVGSKPRWTIMMYRSEVPRGSSISVRARTRISEGAAWGDFVDVVTITSDNEVSDLEAPTSLETPLGIHALGSDLELEFKTDVYGGAPAILDYEVQLTCEASE